MAHEFPSLSSLQLQMIPEISTPTRGAINTEAMALGGPSPGAVEWLNHAASFHYTTPAAVETLVEAVFRQCRYDARCADETFREKSRSVEAYEEHFSWWCRRCWEDRRTKEAAEAVKRQKTQLHRAFVLASFCRFGTTARKAASGACAAGSGGPGGSAELLRSWQCCRQARAWPRQTAEAAENLKDSADAMEWCCGDMRCMHRLLELQPTLKEGKQL